MQHKMNQAESTLRKRRNSRKKWRLWKQKNREKEIVKNWKERAQKRERASAIMKSTNPTTPTIGYNPAASRIHRWTFHSLRISRAICVLCGGRKKSRSVTWNLLPLPARLQHFTQFHLLQEDSTLEALYLFWLIVKACSILAMTRYFKHLSRFGSPASS
jgi:hypothetical protein